MRVVITVLLLSLLLAACGDSADQSEQSTARAEDDHGQIADGSTPVTVLGTLPSTVPPLPFADNPDPEACGIPREWGRDDPARVSGIYEGELVQPIVYLYDSHLRGEVVGQVPDGGRVQILLSQSNPVLDYYFVRSLDLDPLQEGWIPAPFLVLYMRWRG